MPMMTPNCCHTFGCPSMALPGRLYCAEHRRQRQSARAASPSAKLRSKYRRRWTAYRHSYLVRHPMCQWPDCDQAASEVDHRLPISEGGKQFSLENVQALCHHHHAVKTAQDQRKKCLECF